KDRSYLFPQLAPFAAARGLTRAEPLDFAVAAPGLFDFGSFAMTRSYEVLISALTSRRSSASPSSCSITQKWRAAYGAGMMPGRSTSSPNDSGVHLNAIE